MRVLVGGGGTGGHLVPGIAIYKEFQKQGHTVLYVMSERDRAYDIVNELHDPIVVSLVGISRKLSLKTFQQIWSIFQAWLRSFKQIKKFNPDIVVIAGGYLSNIAALSAIILRKPLYMLEQNSVAGITNRFWAKWAKKIYTTFPNVRFIPPHKALLTGNPLLFNQVYSKEEACSHFGFDSKKPVILISGGSQGAKTINDLVVQLLPSWLENNYQVLWSLGTREFDRLQNQLNFLEDEPYRQHVKAFRFVREMDLFWSAGDVAIVRAGAGTVSESLYFHVPCLYIPIYQSPDNHQFLNAKYPCDNGLGKILEEPNLTKETLDENLCQLLSQSSTIKTKFFQSTQKAVEIIYEDLI